MNIFIFCEHFRPFLMITLSVSRTRTHTHLSPQICIYVMHYLRSNTIYRLRGCWLVSSMAWRVRVDLTLLGFLQLLVKHSTLNIFCIWDGKSAGRYNSVPKTNWWGLTPLSLFARALRPNKSIRLSTQSWCSSDVALSVSLRTRCHLSTRPFASGL